jgi:hypothetical protein
MKLNKIATLLTISAVLLSITSQKAMALSPTECKSNVRCNTKCMGEAVKEYDKVLEKAIKANEKLKKDNIKDNIKKNKGPQIAGLSSKPYSSSGTKAAGVGRLNIKRLKEEKTTKKLARSVTYKRCAASQ